MRKLLVLDLRETLMYAVEKTPERSAEFQIDRFHEAIINKLFPGDAELPSLLHFLRRLATLEDVRKIEKRYWWKAEGDGAQEGMS
jgi:hypothetical protein